MWTVDSLEKTLTLGKIEGKRRTWQRMRQLDSITNSKDMNLSKLLEIAKDKEPDGLQSMGWQRIGNDPMTPQQQKYQMAYLFGNHLYKW